MAHKASVIILVPILLISLACCSAALVAIRPTSAAASTQGDKVTVIMEPGCPHCQALEQELTAAGIPFNTIDVSVHPDQSYGLTTVPGLLLPNGQVISYQSVGGEAGLLAAAQNYVNSQKAQQATATPTPSTSVKPSESSTTASPSLSATATPSATPAATIGASSSLSATAITTPTPSTTGTPASTAAPSSDTSASSTTKSSATTEPSATPTATPTADPTATPSLTATTIPIPAGAQVEHREGHTYVNGACWDCLTDLGRQQLVQQWTNGASAPSATPNSDPSSAIMQLPQIHAIFSSSTPLGGVSDEAAAVALGGWQAFALIVVVAGAAVVIVALAWHRRRKRPLGAAEEVPVAGLAPTGTPTSAVDSKSFEAGVFFAERPSASATPSIKEKTSAEAAEASGETRGRRETEPTEGDVVNVAVQRAKESCRSGYGVRAMRELYWPTVDALATEHHVMITRAMTPREILSRVSSAAPERHASLKELTCLFEVANYTARPIGTQTLANAIDAALSTRTKKEK